MKRIEKGPVRGISFKLQEEERERKDNYVPAQSAVDTDSIVIHPTTRAMLTAIGLGDMELKVNENLDGQRFRGNRRDRK